MNHDSVAIVSGGLDSTTLVYDMVDQGLRPHVLSFNYGQRHSKELDFADRTCEKLMLRHDIVDLSNITHLISNSALTARPIRCVCDPNPETTEGPLRECPIHGDDEHRAKYEVPEGHYAQDNMSLTVVPNRNMIMLSIACGVAVNNKYKTIGFGAHAGDHPVYPDCRPAFVDNLADLMIEGNEGFENFDSRHGPIYAPFLEQTKADIAYKALVLGVPFEDTWSCYKGGEKHCGRCGTCVERLEAIDEASKRWNKKFDNAPKDLTQYEDTEFWKAAVTDIAPDYAESAE